MQDGSVELHSLKIIWNCELFFPRLTNSLYLYIIEFKNAWRRTSTLISSLWH